MKEKGVSVDKVYDRVTCTEVYVIVHGPVVSENKMKGR